MSYDYFELLLYLADKTRLFFPLETSTTKISSDLKTSQQTISRKLREMERLGLIARKVNYKGHLISLKPKSIDILREHSKKIQDLFKNKKISITGRIEEGLGEGSYYTSLRHYKGKIRQKLGFAAYPGTLNVRANKDVINSFLNSLISVKIGGFKTQERTFGGVTCYKVTLKGTPAAVAVPERTRYEGVLELISPFNLRKRFNLKTGDKITIKRLNKVGCSTL